MIIKPMRELSLIFSVLTLSGCVSTGGGGTMISGSAAGGASTDANKALIRCAAPLGTLAVSDGRFGGSSTVTTIDPLIRLAVQQSNCFVITGIGNARTNQLLNNITGQQRESGEYRVGSKQHKGQRVAADYMLDPQVIINNETQGGGQLASVGIGMLSGLAGGFAPAVSALAGGMQSKVTVVTLTLTDIRSTVQVGISEGSATASNFNASMGGWGGLLGGIGAIGMSGFTSTPEGKATAAAFFDAYNGMVQSLKNYEVQNVKGGLGRGGQLGVGD